MEILKRPRGLRGRFLDLLSSGNRAVLQTIDSDSAGKLPLSLQNEVLGQWLSTHKPPFSQVLKRTDR